jgi:hypothetical protein
MTTKPDKAAGECQPDKAPSPPAESAPAPATGLPYDPNANPNWVDVTGKAPDDVGVDPQLTEGHPGYDDTGPSELMPPKRFAENQPPKSDG